LYSLAYDSLYEYVHSKNKKLFRDEKEKIYYFKSNAAASAMELPFEFAGKLKKALAKVLVKPAPVQKPPVPTLKVLRPTTASLPKKPVKKKSKA
jgi:hypothetical protein